MRDLLLRLIKIKTVLQELFKNAKFPLRPLGVHSGGGGVGKSHRHARALFYEGELSPLFPCLVSVIE